MSPALRIEHHGAITLLRPMTAGAERWLRQNVIADSWQWVHGALACEPRMAASIIEAYQGR